MEFEINLNDDEEDVEIKEQLSKSQHQQQHVVHVKFEQIIPQAEYEIPSKIVHSMTINLQTPNKQQFAICTLDAHLSHLQVNEQALYVF